MKCKNCKKEMEEIDSGFDDNGDMNVAFSCWKCELWLEAKWFGDKPQKEKWLTKKQYDKKYGIRK